MIGVSRLVTQIWIADTELCRERFRVPDFLCSSAFLNDSCFQELTIVPHGTWEERQLAFPLPSM